MKIAIIGAGAAGMMTMATLVESGISGKDILLFDGNDRMGRKVAITGGGRCNVTTGIIKKKELLPKYIRGAEFLEEAFGLFSPKKCRAWFEDHGIPLKEEDNFRLFPVSDDGWDIIAPFHQIAIKHGVDLHFSEKIRAIQKTSEDAYVVTSDTREYLVDICVITTGGNAYAKTGSEGEGYAFARSLGHTITPLGPSLSSFITREFWGHTISGLVLPNAELTGTASSEGSENPVKKSTGGLLFTHFGISGPATFALSAHLAFETITPNTPKTITINADATKTREAWEASLVEAFKTHPTKSVRNILPFFTVRRYAEIIADQAGSIADKTATTVSKEERKTLVSLLFAMPLTLTERRPGDEFVTAGGVSTEEVDPKTMQSRICPNLYFSGEVLNIDAVTGGFNLQGCWATGYTAGKAIAEKLQSL